MSINSQNYEQGAISDDALFLNIIETFVEYRDSASDIEGIDISRALLGKPTVETLILRERELEGL